MQRLDKIVFPVHKLRQYEKMEKTLLGKVKIKTRYGDYILDDLSIEGRFPVRRAKLKADPNIEIYNLKEKVNYFRQLIKYKSGTTFIDNEGYIFQYKKSTKNFIITSNEVITKNFIRDAWTIATVQNCELPFIIPFYVKEIVTHLSIIHTTWGPLLYDLTSEYHEPYRRKI